MLEILIEFISAVGPIALAIMGVAVSLRPPAAAGRAHFVRAASFTLVGVITAACLFWELRGTDKAIGQIWQKISSLPEPELKGPRLEFSGINETSDSKNVSLEFSNTSDIDATAYFITGSVVITSTHNIDVDAAEREAQKLATEHAANLVNTAQTLSRGMGIGLPLGQLPEDQMSLLLSGRRVGYVVSVAIYTGNGTPIDKLWITQLCAEIIKWPSEFRPCDHYNGYFYADRNRLDFR